MRYALLTAGTVDNVALWDGETPWSESSRAVPIPDGVAVAIGWTFDGLAWAPPVIPLEDAVALVDAHTTAQLEAGAPYGGVTWPLDTDSRVDWLGLLIMAPVLLAQGPVRVVGRDGGLTLSTVEEVQAVAAALAGYRLQVQARSAAAREALLAAEPHDRRAVLAQYLEVP